MQGILYSNPLCRTRRRDLEADIRHYRHTKEYCIAVIASEKHLWDMRFWGKPREEHSLSEVAAQLLIWLEESRRGVWVCNCWHCLSCIEILVAAEWLTIEEVAELVRENKVTSYEDQLGAFNCGLEFTGRGV